MRRMMIVAAAGAFAVFMALAFTGLTQAQAKVLFDFENNDDVTRWEGSRLADTSASGEHATSGKGSMKVMLKKAQFPGISCSKLPVNDWSGYGTLNLDVFADDGVNLVVRIDDENSRNYATRFNLDIRLNKGANTVSIPVADI
ncbi:MAG TPA: hypothetical protein VMZ92_21430, partial [Planctomycetota bacterium]|nr:hypothetical protein [Planctomycetota bacterium]